MIPPSLGPFGPPKRLGKYEVGAKIGGGGMATIYVGRAVDESGREEVVALKVIRDELANDEQFTHMFVDEAKILARLSHPNVIHTSEYGVSGHHRFIAMELLSGRTYADVWDLLADRGEAVPLRLGAWICARIADGLHSAHELVDEAGVPLAVIHRDVNPTNVFLTHAGEVKLIDFGLAKARVRSSQSADGIVKGKIPYLAPEQAQGKPIDRRIDVYALGATLWETATMKRLFKRDTDVDTLLAIQKAFVPDVRSIVDGFPEELWRIIERALQRNADDRFATAREMQLALDAFVGDPSGMMGELGALLARLFPGQEAKQARWMRDAAAVRIAARTMPPPAPVPIASSTMLEDVDSAPSLPSIDSGTERVAPEGTPEEIAGTVPKSRRPPAASSSRAPEAPEPPPPTAKPDEPRGAGDSLRTTVKRKRQEPPWKDGTTADDASARRLWLSIAAALAVVLGAIWWFGR